MLAFTGQQIERLTGLTQRQLAYWEKRGVFVASHVDNRPYRPYRRIYSFRDLVSLKTLALLRREYKVPLEELRRVGDYLRAHVQAPWSEIQFKIGENHHVIFRDPASGEWITSSPLGQGVFPIILFDDVRKEADKLSEQLRVRDDSDIGRISRHRHVMHNRWVVAGTRVPTSAIWNFHEAGYAPEAIRTEYPNLTIADIDAAIAHEQSLRQAA
jgi:uncharacterized protein (DUF433 family)